MNQITPPRGGAAPMLFLFSLVVFAVGLGFDLALNRGRAFWLGAEHGARAVIAAGAVATIVLAARLARLALMRDKSGDGRGLDQP